MILVACLLAGLVIFAKWNRDRLDPAQLDAEWERAERIGHRIIRNNTDKVMRSSAIQKRRLNAGYSWNPWLELPRNGPCPCDSGKKFKNCHYAGMPRAVSAKDAIEAREAMAKAGVGV